MEVLTEREREVMILRDLQDLDSATIAEALEITPVTVRRLSGEARRKVVEWMRRHRPDWIENLRAV